MPVFNEKWILQGIHHSSTSNVKYPHLATRIDSIVLQLNSLKSLANFAGGALERLEEAKHKKPPPKPAEKLYMNKVYWLEWYKRNIWSYNPS